MWSGFVNALRRRVSRLFSCFVSIPFKSMHRIVFTCVCCLVVGEVRLQGNVLALSDTWEPIGDTELNDTGGDGDNGDGPGDGAILVDGKSHAVGQGVEYRFHGTLDDGEALNVTSVVENFGLSYCRFDLQLFNQTDGRVLEETSVVVFGGGVESRTLSTTAGSADDGDILVLRFVRTDPGETFRNFVIDNVRMTLPDSTMWYFPRSSPSRRIPDIPAEAHDSDLQSDINEVISSWYDLKIPSTSPSNAALTNATNAYQGLNIRFQNGVIDGLASDWDAVDFLDVFARELFHNPGNALVREMANNCVRLVGQKVFDGVIERDGRGYDIRAYLRDAVLLKDQLDADAEDYLMFVFDQNLHGFTQFWMADFPGPFAGSLSGDSINTDEIYNKSDSLLIFALAFQSSEVEAQRWAKGFKRYYERFASPSPGTANGIKVDGSGYHHWNSYARYMYAYNTYVAVLEALGSTAIQISAGNYRFFRDAMVAQFVRSRERVKPLSMGDRAPLNTTITIDQGSLLKLAEVGALILGETSADPEVAKVYNAVFGVNSSLGTSEVNDLEGAFQFNHANMLVNRKENWLVTMRGFTDSLWGTEIYTSQNRYGRYQNYGALEVIYDGGAVGGNGLDFEGWDWNHAPGTTTIVLPFAKLHAERGRIDELQQESFAGASTLGNLKSALLGKVHGKYGVFGMKFHEQESQGFGEVLGPEAHNDSFRFRKSAFVFGDLIIGLGSGITNDDSVNRTVTTLFQKESGGGGPIVANGSVLATPGLRSYLSGSPRWILDGFGTGYYLPASNDALRLDWGSQTTPPDSLTDPGDLGRYQTGTFAKAFLDHGTAPGSADYEFAVRPGSSSSEMSSFAGVMAGPPMERPYNVVEKVSDHHIVHYRGGEQDVWGLCLFEASSSFPDPCLVASNDRASLVMYEHLNPNDVLISVSDPDMGLRSRSYAPVVPSVVNLTLKGKWVMGSINDEVTANHLEDGTMTMLSFSLNDGLPQELLISRCGYDTWAGGQFNESQLSDSSVSGPSEDPDRDGLVNLIEYGLGLRALVPDQEVFRFESIDGMPSLSFPVAENCEGLTLTLQVSTNLQDWDDAARSINGDPFMAILAGLGVEESDDPRVVRVEETQTPGS